MIVVNVEKAVLRRVGRAIRDYEMIRPGDRIAVGVSGGKDSLTLLEALRRLQKRSPIQFSLCAFTIEQGKFLGPVEPVGRYIQGHGIEWVYYRDLPSFQLLEENPSHGCDLCSRYRRRAVYEVATGLGANVIALGHTADDLCEALLRNALFIGRLAALPAVTHSRVGGFRLIRPLIYVNEELTQQFVQQLKLPTIPCVCSQREGTIRQRIRQFLRELRAEYPHVQESLLTAMANIDAERLLDLRYLKRSSGSANLLDQTQRSELTQDALF